MIKHSEDRWRRSGKVWIYNLPVLEGCTHIRGYPSSVVHRWLGGGWRRLDFFSDIFHGSHSEHIILLLVWWKGTIPTDFGDWLLIPSPTLSRYMIMGTIQLPDTIDYIGGRALDLESRHLDTWLHTFLAGRLWGKSLSLSNLRFFSYTIRGIIFTNYLTELWWEYNQLLMKTLYWKGHTKVGDHFLLSIHYCFPTASWICFLFF